MQSSNARIIELRELLAEKFPRSAVNTAGRFSTGFNNLDEVLGGGLPLGGITEVISSCGAGLLLVSFLASARKSNSFVALIDGRNSFDPSEVSEQTLARLLWVRCQTAAEALKAADLILRDGNLPLAILDLRSNPADELRKIPATTWFRFQRVVEPTSVALAVLTSRSIVNGARLKLTVAARFTLDAFDRRQTDLLMELGTSLAGASREPLRQFA